MDLDAVLKDLRARLQVIVQAIAELEEIEGSSTASNYFRKRSGRKSMGAEERAQVSERMKKYWAGRRKDGR
jgi:hypothetical protein